MDRYILTKPVDIHGTDFWGRPAFVRLEPTQRRGWYWHVNGLDVQITPELLETRKNRVILRWGDEQLHVFEHLGALRLAGLDNIRIVSKTRWLPYDGSAAIFWNACEPHLSREGELVRYCVDTSVNEYEPNCKRWVTFMPLNAHTLIVRAFIEYPRLGHLCIERVLPGDDIVSILRTPTQGWPPSRRWIAAVASVFGWPHKKHVVWPHEHDTETLKLLFARHRILDILGTLSVLCPAGGFLVGRFESYCGGHKHDVALARRANVIRVAGSWYETLSA